MREILFRGIPKDDTTRHFFADIWKDDCEGSFVYGSLIISRDRYYICVSALCQINSCINNGMTSMIEVIPETIGQYTGLTDKNGNKIFEGDIVKGKDALEKEIEVYGYIDHKNGSFVIVGDLMTHYRWLDYDVEVIGNIHDNPELLKGGTE